jgi:hypothetical protein
MKKALLWSPANKTLYEKTLGSGSWSTFPYQPPIVAASGGRAMAGTRNGDIFVCDHVAQKIWRLPSGASSWVNTGHPGTTPDWTQIVDVGGGDLIMMSGGHISKYESGTWVYMRNSGWSGLGMQAWASSLTDIWHVSGAGGAGNQHVGYWDGATWTDRWSELCADVGFTPDPPLGVWGCGPNEVYISCFEGGRHLIKWNGSSFVNCGQLAWSAYGASGSLHAPDSSHVYAAGVFYTAFDFRVARYNGSSHTLQTGNQTPFSGLNSVRPLWSPDGQHVYITASYGGTTTVWESIDHGSNFSSTSGYLTNDPTALLGDLSTTTQVIVEESARASDDVGFGRLFPRVSTESAYAADVVQVLYEPGTRVSPTSIRTPRAALTAMGRNLVRGAQQGRALVLTRARIGTSWEQPRWARLPSSSEDTTELITPSAWGTVEIEGFNSRALACCCRFQQTVLGAQELVLYARTNDLTEVPFAVSLFPTWFLAQAETRVARVIIPL